MYAKHTWHLTRSSQVRAHPQISDSIAAGGEIIDADPTPDRRSHGSIESIRAALDAFDAPSEAEVSVKGARISAEAVATEVSGALLDSDHPDAVSVFAALVGRAAVENAGAANVPEAT
jgi:hypothetical protein